jgi:hypothetical protein
MRDPALDVGTRENDLVVENQIGTPSPSSQVSTKRPRHYSLNPDPGKPRPRSSTTSNHSRGMSANFDRTASTVAGPFTVHGACPGPSP